jgi:hypothetical protein
MYHVYTKCGSLNVAVHIVVTRCQMVNVTSLSTEEHQYYTRMA